jgi:hypothetical protein
MCARSHSDGTLDRIRHNHNNPSQFQLLEPCAYNAFDFQSLTSISHIATCIFFSVPTYDRMFAGVASAPVHLPTIGELFTVA